MTGFVETIGLSAAASTTAASTTALAPAATSALLAAPAASAAGFSVGTVGGSSALATLSSGLSLATAASGLFSGVMNESIRSAQEDAEQEQLGFAAEETALLADAENIRGTEESAEILRESNRILAAQTAAFAANGLDVSFGTPVATAENSADNATIRASTSRSDAQRRALARRRSSRELILRRNAVGSGRTSSILDGIGSAANTALSVYGRGVQRG